MGGMQREHRESDTTAQKIGRITLGAFMVFAGVGHLTFAREEFRAQVFRSPRM